MEEIWIVQGITGGFSDREEWTVCAFRDEKKAKELVKELTKLARATKAYCADASNRFTIWSFGETDLGKQWLSIDPNASLDYTNTLYKAYKCELR